ncbi:MAG: hypothetical protein ACRYGR_07380 [Janthinobacterium lividum]
MILKKLGVCVTILSLYGLAESAQADDKSVANASNVYPGYEKPSCLTQFHVSEQTEAYKKGAQAAKTALGKSYDLPESVWNQEILSAKTHLREAIANFMKGERGKSVRDLKLAGKKPDELHKELIAAGFQHERVPLRAPKQDKICKYWRRDGTKTSDAQDAQIVPMDIYAHADGGLVRVKPEGVPCPKYSHAVPQATKSVVYNLTAKDGKSFDTRYPNEAFKVTDEGMPLPKGLSPKTGLRLIIDRKEIPNMKEADAQSTKQEHKGWIETIMSVSHVDLAADYTHCPKDDIKEVATEAASKDVSTAIKTETKSVTNENIENQKK